MKRLIPPGPRSGEICAPPSKSQSHRLLICAALSEEESRIRCGERSRDVVATIRCLRALGAQFEEEAETLLVRPIREAPRGERLLPCGESGTTLRLLLPLAGALGATAVFQREGRLPQRPLSPLDRELSHHGMRLEEKGSLLLASGRLRPGEYCLPGNVSSQFISALLMALPLLEGESRLRVEGTVESAPYIAMTEAVLRQAAIRLERQEAEYTLPGGQRPRLSGTLRAEGDWSGAAFFLCMGAMSPRGVLVRGLDPSSAQGDRALLALLRRFGASVLEREDEVLVRREKLCGQEIDASSIPDLIPVLSVLAAAAEGETRIFNAGRLRLKESDRIKTTAALLRDLGGSVEERADGLLIRGRGSLAGGSADSAGDHRVAMSAAVAACICEKPVELKDPACADKSYPRFWEDLERLKGEES